AQRPPWVRTQNFVPTPASLPRTAPTDTGPLLEASSPSVRGALTTLRFRSVWHFTLDFHQTPPRGSRLLPPTFQRPCRFGFGFPPSGPQRTLTSCSAPMPGAPRGRQGCPRCARRRRPPALTTAALSPGVGRYAGLGSLWTGAGAG